MEKDLRPAPPARDAGTPATLTAGADSPGADDRHLRELLPGFEPAGFVVHSLDPLDLEPPRESIGDADLTSERRMFIRANLPLPPADILDDRDAWTFTVCGVGRPGNLTLGRLKTLERQTVAAVIQCAGNGRTWFEHRPEGTPWETGAASNALWTGVPVRAVAELLGGVAGGARYLTATGGEPIPAGVEERDVVVERSIPLRKGLADCLLAWEMNGEPIPLPFGGPLRLIVPGYYGVNQIKHLRRLAFTADESDADIQRNRYRLQPLGEGPSPEQPSMWEMSVKSWITSPGARRDTPAGGRVASRPRPDRDRRRRLRR